MKHFIATYRVVSNSSLVATNATNPEGKLAWPDLSLMSWPVPQKWTVICDFNLMLPNTSSRPPKVSISLRDSSHTRKVQFSTVPR